jgi:hypothetical protein
MVFYSKYGEKEDIRKAARQTLTFVNDAQDVKAIPTNGALAAV